MWVLCVWKNVGQLFAQFARKILYIISYYVYIFVCIYMHTQKKTNIFVIFFSQTLDFAIYIYMYYVCIYVNIYNTFAKMHEENAFILYDI